MRSGLGWVVAVAVAVGCGGSGSDLTASGTTAGTSGGPTSSGADTGTSAGDAPTTGATGTSTASGEATASASSSDSGAVGGSSSTGGDGSSSSSSSSAGEASSSGEGPPPDCVVEVENPGFEADPVAAGSYDDKIVPAGWSEYDPDDIVGLDYNSLGVLNPTGTALYPGGAPEGDNVALIFLWRDQTSGSPAGYVQTLGAAALADTAYTLRVRVGNIAAEGGVPYDLSGFPGYRVELLAGGTVVAADDDTLAPAEGEFLESVVEFTAEAGDPAIGLPLAVRLVNLNAADSGIEVNFDDVRLTCAPAP
ncbi:MAG: hypothetical protein JNL82_19455 [Myxococcales bacterium]|nr:hypothetical protein [Myxococcales bacterium]